MDIEGKGYNERLFNGGIRTFFHEGRFRWLNAEMKKLKLNSGSILELGCFDGKSINYLPFTAEKYVGYDANWEGGLDISKTLWKHKPEYKFEFCDSPALFNPSDEVFDYGIAMETLEHLPLASSDEFLEKIASSTKSYGFFSIPNEQGFVFLIKYFIKKNFLQLTEPYTTRELIYALKNQPEKVERNEGSHKGFSYKAQIEQIQKYFDVVSVKGIPFVHLPLSCNFTIGIVVKKKG